MSTPLEEKGARHKDSYFPLRDENASELKDTDVELKRLTADFLRIARNRSPSPIKRRTQQRSTNQSLKSLHSL